METLTREDGCPKITIDRVDHGMSGYILYCKFTVESLNPHLEVDKCECADDVWTLVKFHRFLSQREICGINAAALTLTCTGPLSVQMECSVCRGGQ